MEGELNDAGAVDDAYGAISRTAASFRIDIGPEELTELAEGNDIGEEELRAVRIVFDYLADKHRGAVIETLLRMSRLPRKVPKTFDSFDFSRIQGRDASALRKLQSLSNLRARKNLAFVGPGRIGKTHLAQAYGYECRRGGYKTYYMKASELRDKLKRAAESGSPSRAIGSLVKPSCLIVDEVGRCTFDKVCTDLFFDVADRRYEKEVPNTLILTSNTPVNNWAEFFTGDDTMLCTLDRIFDKASVFVMRGPSYRGAECDPFSVEAVPSVAKLR